jgi:hypothetical protein
MGRYLEESPVSHLLSGVSNGDEATKYLRRVEPFGNIPHPDLIFQDSKCR